jgi:protein-tyrosine-phosphatase
MGNVKKILFVCTGNSCRSVMAERLFQKLSDEKGLGIEAYSAGISAAHGWAASDETVELLRQRGIDASRHQSQPVTPELIAEADLIVAMTDTHEKFFHEKYPDAKDKVILSTRFIDGADNAYYKHGIPDPIGMGGQFYQNVFEAIEKVVNGIFQKIEATR